MNGQVDKKRNIIIGDKTIRVQSRRITINIDPEVKAGKVKLNNIWYIFDLNTGNVIYQGNNWTDCLNGVKKFITDYI
jgi:hypothetical protein